MYCYHQTLSYSFFFLRVDILGWLNARRKCIKIKCV